MSMLEKILFIISSVFVWIGYHKIFNVIYFDFSRGCLIEIIISCIGGVIITFLIMHFWYISIPVILLLLYGMFKK